MELCFGTLHRKVEDHLRLVVLTKALIMHSAGRDKQGFSYHSKVKKNPFRPSKLGIVMPPANLGWN